MTVAYTQTCVHFWVNSRRFILLYPSIMAAMSRTLCPFHHFNSLLTCMESALIISPWSRFPISIASLDLPVPVAPKITTNDGNIALRETHCTVRADAAMMALPRHPADIRAHAQWACRWEASSVTRQQAIFTLETWWRVMWRVFNLLTLNNCNYFKILV